MQFYGEMLSLVVAILWTITALFSEVASKRLGPMPFNVIRMLMSLGLFGIFLYFGTGAPYPQYADFDTWLWLSVSGIVGYVIGDYCLFNSYVLIGSRFGQLLMTLAPPSAAIFGFILLGESMTWLAVIGMLITISGIAVSLYERKEGGGYTALPSKGILFGIGAGVCQGIGLVLSAKGLTEYSAALQEQQIGGAWVIVFYVVSATCIRSIAGFLGFTVWAAMGRTLADCFRVSSDTKGMLCAFCATVTGPFLGVTLSLAATRATSTGIAQTIMSLTPVLILIPSWLLFRQRIKTREIIGAIIAVCGVSLFFQ